MPACTFGFKCESVDMTVRLQPRFENGPEITEITTCVSRETVSVEHLSSGYLFVARLVGHGFCLVPFYESTEGTFVQ